MTNRGYKTIYSALAAEEKEADILIFPELALTGYPPEDLLLRESFVGKFNGRFPGNIPSENFVFEILYLQTCIPNCLD